MRLCDIALDASETDTPGLDANEIGVDGGETGWFEIGTCVGCVDAGRVGTDWTYDDCVGTDGTDTDGVKSTTGTHEEVVDSAEALGWTVAGPKEYDEAVAAAISKQPVLVETNVHMPFVAADVRGSAEVV